MVDERSKRLTLAGATRRDVDLAAGLQYHKRSWQVPDGTGKELSGKQLTLHITHPGNGSKALPVVILFSGFLASASWYYAIVRGLAAAGHVVVQYDPPVPDWLVGIGLKQPLTTSPKLEVPVFDALMAKLQHENDTGSDIPSLKGLLDTSRIHLVGHSRGGAVAALMHAGNSNVIATHLLDPVDLPLGGVSAGNILCSSGRPVGISPADITGMFNPPCYNYKKFYKAGTGTQLYRSADSLPNLRQTHMLFCDAGGDPTQGLCYRVWGAFLNLCMLKVDLCSLPLLLDQAGNEPLRKLVETKGMDAVLMAVIRQVLVPGPQVPDASEPRLGRGGPSVLAAQQASDEGNEQWIVRVLAAALVAGPLALAIGAFVLSSSFFAFFLSTASQPLPAGFDLLFAAPRGPEAPLQMAASSTLASTIFWGLLLALFMWVQAIRRANVAGRAVENTINWFSKQAAPSSQPQPPQQQQQNPPS